MLQTCYHLLQTFHSQPAGLLHGTKLQAHLAMSFAGNLPAVWAQAPVLPLSFSDLSQNYLAGSIPDQHTATQYDRRGSLILSPMHGPGLCGPIPEGVRLGSESGGIIHSMMPAGPCPGTIRPDQQARLLCTSLFRNFVGMEHGRLFV